MKRVFIYGIFTMVLLFSLAGCSSTSIEKVDVYYVEEFSDTAGELVSSFTDSKEIETFKKTFRKAKRQPGIVDMAEPQYRVEFETQTYYLWSDKEHGTIMNLEDTHTINSLSEKNAKTVYNLINH